ncbi:mitochondrial pyruvate dehydrogenase kinase-like protein [Rhizodiscina lignyota]|uniref:Protein-serine/threonine kinase n=1 Tax=Rhizodiscina lignyota TaxID=1504668 RepID=A0A9P4IL35_9PEZI|nr:mitochondrial pyruvate dehydrogenase kinase-like protein [Rhizodiscina lignyota]
MVGSRLVPTSGILPHRALTTQTVTDDHIAELAAKPLHPLTLTDLVKYGRPPLPASALYESANFTLSILPARLAHRIQSLRNLPFIVVSNPHISKIHNNYLHSLSTLLPWSEKQITNLEDEIKFTEVMADLVQTHSNTISILARGFLEARKYISPVEVTRFLDEHLRARIGTRLIAEQHIALHFSSQPHTELSSDSKDHRHDSHGPDESHQSSYIGVIDTDLHPASIIRHCEGTVGDICELRYGVRPSVVINGEPDYTFAHIPVHLEYIITELLKNAFRATVERGMEREPIEVTIAPLPEGLSDHGREKGLTNQDQGNMNVAMSDVGKEQEAVSENIRPLKQSTPGVTIRMRDRGGGISPENLAHIWDYSFTTFKEEELISRQQSSSGGSASIDALNAISGDAGGSSLAGLGYGLPLGRAYAEYFGGGIAVQSLWGWGTDVYLSLRGVGRVECEGRRSGG